MSELEALQSEISNLENQIFNLKNQVKEKKHAIIEHKHSQQPIFAQRLRKARLNAGLTQTKLAEKAGTTQGAITSYEIARREPPIKTLVQLADTLNVSLDWLCGRTEKMTI